MGERIIMVFCCLPCAATFTILGIAAWRKKTPVHFWTGTNVTADEVTDVRAYNRANAKMWFAYSFPYWLAAAISFQNALLAGVILGVSATFGTLGIVVWYTLRIEKRYKWKYVQFHQSLQAEQEKREKFLRTKTKLEKYLDIFSAVLMIGTVLWVAVMWRSLPERIPRHYNAMGEADAWSGKGMLLFDLVTEAGMYLLMIVLGKGMGMWNVPQKKTKEEQEKVYLYCGHMISILTLVMVVMFSYMTVCSALGVSLGNGFIWFSLVGTIVPAIYYTVKMYN